LIQAGNNLCRSVDLEGLTYPAMLYRVAGMLELMSLGSPVSSTIQRKPKPTWEEFTNSTQKGWDSN